MAGSSILDRGSDPKADVAENKDILNELSALVSNATRLLTALSSIGVFKEARLSLSEWVALMILRQSDEIGNNQLAKRLGVTRQRAHQIVASFESAGLIVMHTSPIDSRRNEISLTEAGDAKLEAINRKLISFYEATLEQDERSLLMARRNIGRIVKSIGQTKPATVRRMKPAARPRAA